MAQSGGYAQGGYGAQPSYGAQPYRPASLAGFGGGGQQQPAQPAAQPAQPYRPAGLNFGQQPGLAGAGLQYQQQQGGQGGNWGGGNWGGGTPGAAPNSQTAQKPAAPAPAGQGQGAYVDNGQGGKTWIPQVTETTTLSPVEQKIFDQSTGLQLQGGTLAGNLMSNVPTDKMSFAGAPAMPTGGGFNQEAHDAVYQQQTAQLDPQFAVQEQQLKDDLRDKGIPEGSAAYQQQMDQFNRDKTYAYGQARDAAIQEGYSVANQQFNQGMAARQQGVTEAQTLYQQPMNTLASAMTSYQGGGGAQSPTASYNPGQVAGTDVTGAYSNYNTARNTAYGNQANVYGSNVGGATGLAGALAARYLYQ